MVMTKFAQKRLGTLNQFYTRSGVGRLLVDQLGGNLNPAHVLDLGAGTGSLSIAVAHRWPAARFTTVDIDIRSTAGLKAGLAEVEHDHIAADVLAQPISALPHYGDFDLAVCNPPFFKPAWSDSFAPILAAANLSTVASLDVTGELLFMAQNLAALKHGGTLGLIAPDGLLTGKRNAALRRHLLENHRIETVIQLPANAFTDTDACCFIVIIRKDLGPTKSVKLLRYAKDAGLSAPLAFVPNHGENRLDYDHHRPMPVSGGAGATLRQLGADIRRGRLNTVTVREQTYPTFHTTDYERERLNFTGDLPADLDTRLVVAEPGDILVARVDRSFYKKVAIVESGRAVLTDCVYRVRLPKPVQEPVFAALRSTRGEAAMKATSKGVGAKLLGKADFLDIALIGDELNLLAKELLQERERFPLLL